MHVHDYDDVHVSGGYFQDTELAPMHGAKAFMEFIDASEKRRRPEVTFYCLTNHSIPFEVKFF